MRHILPIAALLTIALAAQAQPAWQAIKAGATFHVADTAYGQPHIQPLQVPGWEDGLYITRNGRHLYSTYLPCDALSWSIAIQRDPICFNFHPYLRLPLVGVDTLTNPFGCRNYMNSDIVTATRADTAAPFAAWQPSGLRTPALFDGGAAGVQAGPDVFDVFVFTRDSGGPAHTDIMLAHGMAANGTGSNSARPILSSPAQEDNPHIERLPGGDLLLFFDRDRRIYYSLSRDDGATWQEPILITHTLNEQAPYDVQPHLWHDCTSWWVYFCADSPSGKRGIYKARQQTTGDWDSWGPKELVLEGDSIQGGVGAVYAVGEPTLTAWGDLSFVVIYGDASNPDSTDRYDCDPWLLPRKHPVQTTGIAAITSSQLLRVTPNPASHSIRIQTTMLAGQEDVQIINEVGQTVLHLPIPSSRELDITALPPGVYTLATDGKRCRLIKL